MAEIIEIPGAGPVNAGERKVLDHFAGALGPDVRIFPNVQLLVGFQELIECDQIIIAPDRLWVIEVKDLYGDVKFLKGNHIVDGDRRSDPVSVTKLKAQRIKSRLKKLDLADGVFVEYLVVLAKRPKALEVAPDYVPFVRSMESAAAVLDRPSEHGYHQRSVPADQRAAIEKALDLRPRLVDVKPKFGNIVAEELQSEAADRQWWRAREVPLGVPWQLEVLVRPKGITDAAWRDQEALAIENVRLLKAISGAPGVLVPQTVLRHDDGRIAIAHPFTRAPSLAEHADAAEQWPEELRRKVLRTVAMAVDAAGSRSIAHRLIGPAAVRVDEESGRTRLTRFSLAHRKGEADRVPPEVWPHLAPQIWAAPEHLAGGPVGVEADLFAVGRLAQHLWPDGVPADLAPAVTTLLAEDSAARADGLEVLRQVFRPASGPEEPKVGSTWAGYRLEEQLGIGAEVGVSVWRGVSDLTGQQVVLRIVDADGDHEGVAELAQALQGVDHDAIAEFITAGIEEGRAHVVTELVTGGSVRAVLEQHGPLGREAAVTAAVQILDGLTHVHPGRDDGAPSLVHRRISSDNIIVHPERGAVVVNFAPQPDSESQAVLNDPRYRPLQEGIGRGDPDADLFAVAVLLHELATGAHPFTDGDPLTGTLELHDGLGRDLAEVLARGLASDRDDRFTTAQEFLAALVALGLPQVAPPPVADDVLDTMRRIDAAMRERRWDEALELCPEGWTPVRARIETERAVWERVVDAGALLEVGGFRLCFVREERGCIGTLTDNTEVVGDRRVYLADRDDGVALEISSFTTAQRAGAVVVSDIHHSGAPFTVLENRLRMGARPMEDGSLSVQLTQGRLKVAGKPGLKDAGAFLASEEELDAGAGVDVAATLARFGATAFGPESELLPPKKRASNYLCVIFPPDAVDLPAVAHLLTRVLPIARGVVNG